MCMHSDDVFVCAVKYIGGRNVHTLDTERGSGEIDFRYRRVLSLGSHTIE